jgi:hypothetical protein
MYCMYVPAYWAGNRSGLMCVFHCWAGNRSGLRFLLYLTAAWAGNRPFFFLTVWILVLGWE